MKNITNLRTWSTRAKNAAAALLFLAAYTISMVAPFVPVAYAASIPSNKVGFSSVGFILGGSYSMVSGQPTGVGELKNGNVGGYPEGACIPAEFKVKNNSSSTGDTVISPIYDYYGSGVVGITNYERVTTGLSGDPSASADNLNDFTFTGQPLSSATSFPSTAGSISANVTGPYAGDNAGTTATTSTDAFRHYNISLTNIPAGATVYIMLCGRLGLDASEYPGASLSLRTVQGGAENVPIPVNQIRVLPSITVTKTVSQGSALPSDFSFTVSPSVNNGLSSTYTIPSGQNSVVIPNVNPDGSYTITESGPAGYVFTGGTGTACAVVPATVGTAVGQMSATVAAGKPATNATCNFTNAVQTGSITITKDAIPNSAQDFSFTTTGSGLTNFSLDDDANATLLNTRTFNNLLPGTYTITEDAVTGWDFDNLSCTGTGVVKNGSSVTITLAPGALVSCTYTNRQQGKIIVNKFTNPSGDLASFPVSISPTADVIGATTGSVTTASPVTFTVKQGTYSVTEDLSGLSNWTNTGNTCTNLTINGNTPIVNGVPTLSCTITNAKLAKLTIVKDAVPNDAQDFSFTTSGTGLSNFSLDDDADATLSNTKVFSNLALGQTYTVSEDALTGWKLTNLACSGGATASPATVGAISFVPTAGQEATCTYTNTKLGSIAGLKWDDLNGDGVKDVTESTLDNWTINLTGTDMNGQAVDLSYITGTASPGSGAYSFDNLLPGTYTVTETQQTNWVQTSTNPAPINLSAGQNVTSVDFGNRGQGTITVVKHLSPTSDEGKFNLFIDGNEDASNVGHNGTTGALTVWAGSHSVSETGVTLSNYSTTYSCSNGQSGTGTSITGITVNAGDAITCTITNARKQGTVKVVKDVTNDNGGTKTAVNDFTFKNNNGTAQTFVATTNPDGERVLTLPVGSTFNIVEVEANQGNYTTTYSGTCSGTVTEVEQVCTISNNDNAPKLTLVKKVTNDNGGARATTEWMLTATGPTTISDAGGAVSGASFDQGTYTLSETGPTDYTKGSWSCTGKTVTNDQVVIGLGDDVTCEITNDDKAPSLILVKYVENDNGGTKAATDWTLSAVGPTSISGAGGAKSGASFDKGTYTLGETDITGYHVGKAWSCSPVTNTGTSITLGLGESTTCEITNDDDPASITGTKTIANTDLSWATDGKPPVSGWVIYLDQNQNGVLDQDEDSTTTDTDGNYSFGNLIAGVNYYVTEVLTSLGNGWAQITGVTNPVNLTLGQNSTGNDFSNEARGTITVVKNVDDGFGVISEDVSDWEWAYDGVDADKTEIATGSTNTQTVPSGTYTVTETQKAGYHVTASSCNPAEPSDKLARTLNGILDPSESQEVLVGLDGDIVCAFTNTRDTGTLEVNKVVDDGYGNKTENPEGWTWHLDEAKADYDMGESKKLTTGSYTFSENVKDDYAFTALACTRDGEPFEIAQDEQVTIEIGYNEAVECTFTNTRDMGDLTIFKDALPNSTQPFEFSVEPVLVDTEEEMMIAEPDDDRFGEGTAPKPFDLIDSGDNAETRQWEKSLPTGWYSVTETSVTGWDLTDMDCGDAEWFAYNDNQLLVYLGNDDSLECTFTNTQRAQLTIVKDVQPDSTKAFSFKTNLEKDESGADKSFSLIDDGSGLGTNSKKFSNVLPGTYTVTEDQLDGWKLDNVACTGTGVMMTRDGAKLTVTLAPGAVASCSFVNSFIPQVLAETYVLADTGNDITITVLMSTITLLLALGVTLYRRKADMA